MYKEQLIEQLLELLIPEEVRQLAKLCEWLQRTGKIHPFEFLAGQLCGQLSAVHPSLSAQSHSYQNPVTRQAVDQRYNPQAVQFFAAVFERALSRSLARKVDAPATALLQAQFTAVRLFDSTQIACPESLAQIFPGCGGGGSRAGIKVLLGYEYLQSQFEPLAVLPAKRSDQGLAGDAAGRIGPGELGLFDKGFYDGPALRGVQERGGYFVLPWPRSVSVWEPGAGGAAEPVAVAQRLRHHAGNTWELDVRLGQGVRALCAVRLIAYRLAEEAANRRRAALREKYRANGGVPCADALELAGGLILITNVPAHRLPVKAVGYLYRVRWQIELIFKQLKSVLRMDQVPTGNQERLRCEIWARLLCGVLLFTWHRYANAACWAAHGREISFGQLARRLAQSGGELARFLFVGGHRLHALLSQLWEQVLKSARKGHQKSRKTTRQMLYEQWLEPAMP